MFAQPPAVRLERECQLFAESGRSAMTAFDRGCVKTPTARVFGSCKMSPEAPIVDCGPFCAVGFLRTIDKSEFSHSLDPKRTVALRAQSLAEGVKLGRGMKKAAQPVSG